MKKFFSKLFDNSNYIRHLETRIEEQDKEWNKLVDEKDKLQEAYDNMCSETYNDSVSIDWKSMEAFSIERLMLDGGRPTTVIGWFKPDSSVGEWKLYCSKEQHERLTQEFNDYVKTKGE